MYFTLFYYQFCIQRLIYCVVHVGFRNYKVNIVGYC